MMHDVKKVKMMEVAVPRFRADQLLPPVTDVSSGMSIRSSEN